jgi:hypothetical protein
VKIFHDHLCNEVAHYTLRHFTKVCGCFDELPFITSVVLVFLNVELKLRNKRDNVNGVVVSAVQ